MLQQQNILHKFVRNLYQLSIRRAVLKGTGFQLHVEVVIGRGLLSGTEQQQEESQ
jgi:hypothetical protein